MSREASEKKLKAFLKRRLSAGINADPESLADKSENGFPEEPLPTGAEEQRAVSCPLSDAEMNGTDSDALVWIREGQVEVQNPTEPGGRARILSTDKLRLYVNGRLVTGIALVSETDQIAVEPVVERSEPELRLKVSPNGLEAHLTIRPGRTVEYLPVDQEPQFRLQLTAESHIVEIAPPTYESAVELLAHEGVEFGIDYPYLEKIFNEPIEGTYLVARGRPPQPGEPDRVEFFFSLHPFMEKADSKDNIDFRELRQLQSVGPGTCLAVLQRGTAGVPGTTVRGKKLPPPPQRRLKLVAGLGTQLLDEGTKVEATNHGLPTVETSATNYVFKVEPVFVQEGDLTILEGNVRFRGSVQIKGNVHEGMIIEATENVLITGSVNQGKISTAGHLQIKGNVFASSIQAGHASCNLLKKVRPQLQEVTHQVSLLVSLADQVQKSTGFQELDLPFRLLVLNLIEIKFPRLRGQVFDLCTSIREIAPTMPTKIQELVDLLENNFTGLNLAHFANLQSLQEFYAKLNFICGCSETAVAASADLRLPYAVNSRIEATGRVFITGSGTYHCTVVAGGDVYINGVLRGGTIVAEGNVHIEEAGSQIGVATWIKVSGNRKISIARVHPEVVVQVGPRRYQLSEPKEFFKARMLHNDRLDIQGLNRDREPHQDQ